MKIDKPTIVSAAGTPPKQIEEFIGCVNSGTDAVSIARMKSPAGWSEPGQCPEFDEYTVVIEGTLRVETREGGCDVAAGQAYWARRGQWLKYSTPDGAQYISVCLPAFTPSAVNRD